MKSKSFKEYLKKRLNPEEIAEIEHQAKMEFESLKSLQTDVSSAVSNFMKEKKMGFNELGRKLDISPSQISKIQKGEANLTLSSLAHLAALFNKRPHIIFEEIESFAK